MSKWADYCISAVRFNDRRTHIDLVRACPDNGDQLGQVGEYAREDIVDALRRGVTFVTIYKGTNGQWKQGQPVSIIRIGGIEYIKTADNGKGVDNLDNLPEF